LRQWLTKILCSAQGETHFWCMINLDLLYTEKTLPIERDEGGREAALFVWGEFRVVGVFLFFERED
jgi:hypothetical protein